MSKRGAYIERGKCVGVSDFAEDVRLAHFGAVEIPDGYGVGDTFDGKQWYKTEPSIDELLIARKKEIIDSFSRLDRAEIRPLAAIVNGLATEEDKDKLSALETQKSALRAELVELELKSSRG